MSGSFKAAEGIRGIACLIVLLMHAVIIFYYGFDGLFAGVADVGVWLFFVLSAFLLTVKFERDGFSAWSISTYIIGRFLRIIPLFTFFIMVYWYFGTADINTVQDVGKAIFMVEGYRHLWTVPVEFKFYLILPFIAFALIFVKRNFGLLPAVLLGIAMIIVQQMIWPYSSTPGQSISPVWYLSCFTMGIVAAVSVGTVEKYSSPRLVDLVFLVCISLAVMATPFFRFKVLGIAPDGYFFTKALEFCAGCSILVLFCISGKGIAGRILSSAPLRLIGRWSFSIYLGHWLVVMKIAANNHENFAAMMLCVAISILMGAAVFYSIESPIERFRHQFMRRTKQAVERLKSRTPVIAPE